MRSPAKPVVVFVWSNFGPYHIDRLEAAAAVLSDTYRVVGIEIAGSTDVYAWDRTEQIIGVERITLFRDRVFESVPRWRLLIALIGACGKAGGRDIFLCHYERVETFFLAAWLRLTGRHVYLMIESKFDDKPRRIWWELLKVLAYLPYSKGLVGGFRGRDYLGFFGFNPERVEFGYDTVSMDRIRKLAGGSPAPEGVDFRDRHFTIVARLVPKKNIAMALEAYARYCRTAGSAARELHICGSGVLENELRKKTSDLGLHKVVFRGFVQAPELSRVLASTLALVLPSTEEQWGLVINEAIAMGLPILCSFNVGARDLLVRIGVNGFIFEPDNPDGLAYFMNVVASDEAEWRRLAKGSTRMTALADSRYFADAVKRLMNNRSGERSS
jgi:glycosyltransferase involved in cell wall biosynthesis